MAKKSASGDAEWLSRITANLLDDDVKLIYADWLAEHGDKRGDFLRQYVAASRSMKAADLPSAKGLPGEWLELIGFQLINCMIETGLVELKEPVLRFARPALRMKEKPTKDAKIAVGESKIGGLPDLPPDVAWPLGGDCRAIYNDDTEGVDSLAGFLAQVNLAEITHTQAAKDLPKSGVLSFFCYQDIEHDNPDVIGAKTLFFPDAEELVRTEPPDELTEGNTVMPSRRLLFEETLDLPEENSGPWSDETRPDPEKDYDPVYGVFRSLNFKNMLGYGRSTSGGDPTPSRESRHLILLENAVGCRLHLQIHRDDLAACNFDALKLEWVDFD